MRALLVAGIVALLAVVVGASPSYAANAQTVTINCVTEDQDQITFYELPGDTISINSVHCGHIETWDNTWGTRLSHANIVQPEVITAEPNDSNANNYQFCSNSACDKAVDVQVVEASPAYAISEPLLLTHDAVLSATPGEMTVAQTGVDGGNTPIHSLGGNSNCQVAADNGGEHVYSTIDIAVTKAGTYTFQATGSTPVSGFGPNAAIGYGSYTDPLGLLPYAPVSDPFLALYSNGFDPNNVDSNVVGCNDDASDVGTQADVTYTSSNQLVDGHMPWFQASLQPGNYTLLVTTWDSVSLSDWQAGTANPPAGAETFTPGPESVTFNMYGPDGGLQLGHITPSSASTSQPNTTSDSPALAATGADATPAVTAVAALGALGLLLFVAPRRRRRVEG